MAETDVFQGLNPEVKFRTKKMMMWFIVFAVLMLFAGITSAMIVLHGKLLWVHVVPPTSFWVSNALIVLSSIALILGLRSIRQGKQQMGLIWTLTTLLLGLGFTLSQHTGWQELKGRNAGSYSFQNEQGFTATNWNKAGKMLGTYGTDFWIEMKGQRLVLENGEYYLPTQPDTPVTNTVMTTFNASTAMLSILVYVHIVHLFFGLVYLVRLSWRIHKGVIHQGDNVSMYSAGVYWHFLGILWLYLFAFVFYIY
jgi:cytochrome c oxidase subunit III